MKTTTKLILGLALFVGYISISDNVITSTHGAANGNSGGEVTGTLVPPAGNVIVGETPTIGWLIDRPEPKNNNGHGNNVDGVDSSNPGDGGGGPNGAEDTNDGVDDENSGTIIDPALVVINNEIRQIDYDSGITMFLYTNSDSGEGTVAFPISEAGSEFELWAELDGVLTFMDNMVVGGLPPTANFMVNTQDPWVGSQTVTINGQQVTQNIHRTRSDIEFSINAQVGNLSLDPAAPLMAKVLDLYHEGRNARFDWSIMDYPLGNEFNIANERVDASAPYSWVGLTRLRGQVDARIGIEDIKVQTLGGEWTSPDGLQTATINTWSVGSASVIVWPVATGHFTQLNDNGDFESFTDGQTFYNQKINDIFVNYRDLYPGSKTYVQIYKGAPDPGQVGLPILAVTHVPSPKLSQVQLDAIKEGIAQNTVEVGIKIRAVDLQQHINYMGNGTYTLEIISGDMDWLNAYMNGDATAPYYEIIGSCTFDIDQRVLLNGQIGTK